MKITFQHSATETFHVVSCYTCGVPFGITSSIYRRVVTDAEGSVHCPACGNMTCWCESKAEKEIKRLQGELKTANTKTEMSKRTAEIEMDKRQRAENSLRTTKGVVTKIKQRVGKGVCPCCNRSFRDLQRHMNSKHPDYSEEA